MQSKLCLLIVHSSVAPVAGNNSEVAAQSLTDSVQQLLTSFMDNARSRLEHEVCVVYLCVCLCLCTCVCVLCVCVCCVCVLCVCFVCVCVCMCVVCTCVRVCVCVCVVCTCVCAHVCVICINQPVNHIAHNVILELFTTVNILICYY